MKIFFFNFTQIIRELIGLKPLGCTSTNPAICHCLPGFIFQCASCKKMQPWCKGCDDDQFDVCDDCYIHHDIDEL